MFYIQCSLGFLFPLVTRIVFAVDVVNFLKWQQAVRSVNQVCTQSAVQHSAFSVVNTSNQQLMKLITILFGIPQGMHQFY